MRTRATERRLRAAEAAAGDGDLAGEVLAPRLRPNGGIDGGEDHSPLIVGPHSAQNIGK